MKTLYGQLLFALALSYSGGQQIVRAAGSAPTPPPTVRNVDVIRYIGLWYEQRRMPNDFQDSHVDGYGPCRHTTAEYSIKPQGKVGVLNTCYRYNRAGQQKVDEAVALARFVRNSGNAKLKVNFTGNSFLRTLGIGDGNYWILALGPINHEGQYDWALVGSPRRDYGWILSRDEYISSAKVNKILDIAEDLGYQRSSFKSGK